MDELILNIFDFAYPAQESIKYSDFSTNVNNLNEYIISIFRKLSVQYLSSLINGLLDKITIESSSENKRKRYAAAVCISSLFILFPYDEYIPQYAKVVKPLLAPGYKPILHIGAIVVGRLAHIAGEYRDIFLHDLVSSTLNDLKPNNPPDVRYAAAVIWDELAKTAPEILFTFDTELQSIILENFQAHDRVICEILINVIYSLFTSESSSIATGFLLELQELLIATTTKFFSDTSNPDEIIIYCQLLHILLRLKPYISTLMAESLVLVKCKQLIKSQNLEIILNSIAIISRLHKIKVVNIDKSLYNEMINILFEWSKLVPLNTLDVFKKFIKSFPAYLKEDGELLLRRLQPYLAIQDGPIFVYNILVAIIGALPRENNIIHFLTFISHHLSKSTIPIYTLLTLLHNTRPRWTKNYVYFLNQLLCMIRQELISQSPDTTRLNISLLSLLQIPIQNLDDALELNTLIMELTTNKDVQVREKIARVSLHLFAKMPDKIPLVKIIKLVKFALDDTSRSVRLNTLRAFGPSTYKLLSQPDIFPIFSKFAYDESPEVRKEALLIFASLHVVTGTVVRNLLLSSLKLMASETHCFTTESIPMWFVFPRLIIAATPWLNIYAESIFQKLMLILEDAFSDLSGKGKAQSYMTSCMYQDIYESLIKSIAKLYQICPDLIPIKPILNIYIKILKEPVHSWIKIHVLKSLKNLGSIQNLYEIKPEILPVLLDFVLKTNPKKLVIKAMKVIGTIGIIDISRKAQATSFFYLNSLSNPRVFRNFFVSTLINFLNNEFKSTNIESKRENITGIISVIFRLHPDMVPQYLDPFLGTFLSYIQETGEIRSIFFEYMRQIIECGGHLMIDKAQIIYDSIKKEWHSAELMTKEASEVFRSLVIATMGQCETILNPIIIESFQLLKMTLNSQQYAFEIYELLNAISEYAPGYMSIIIPGIIEFLNQSYPLHLQEFSLNSIKFMLHHCKVESHLSFIKRCLNSILLRPQQRFKDKATQLLNEANSICRSQSIEKFSNSNELSPTKPLTHLRTVDIINNSYIDQFVSMLDIKNLEVSPTQWFINLRNFLFMNSSSGLIKAMRNLQNHHESTFELAFIHMWNEINELQRTSITNNIEMIISSKNLPRFIFSKFVNLIEFSILCNINLNIDILAVARRCEEEEMYSFALFFLETFCIYHDHELSTEIKQSLVKLNQIVGRYEDAHSIAMLYRSEMDHHIWMHLSEWNQAIEYLDKHADEEDHTLHFIEKITSLANLDDWENVRNENGQINFTYATNGSHVARYLWTAESYNGSMDLALKYAKLTGAYSVEERIEKAVLYYKNHRLDKAKKNIHIGWRYVGASIVNESSNLNFEQIQNMLFRAQQLFEINRIANNKLNNKIDKSHSWEMKLNDLNDHPVYQKELFKICSLQDSNKDELDRYAFKILRKAYNGRFGFSPELSKLATIFFSDKNSEQIKFISLWMKQNSIEELKQLDQETNNEVLKSEINRYISKQILFQANSIEDLKSAHEYIEKANGSLLGLIKSNILLAYSLNDNEYADVIIKMISKQSAQIDNIQLLLVLSLLLKFDFSIDDFIQKVDFIPIKVLESICYTLILLLSHKSDKVKQLSNAFLLHLCSHSPQSISFHLLNNQHVPLVSELIFRLQREHPTILSQVMLISTKFELIANNLNEKWIETVKLAYKKSNEGHKEEALEIIAGMKKTLIIHDLHHISNHDKDFLDRFGQPLLALINQIEQNQPIQTPNLSSDKFESNLSNMSALTLKSESNSTASMNSSMNSFELLNTELNSNLVSNFSSASESTFSECTESSRFFEFDTIRVLLKQMVKMQTSHRIVPISSFDDQFENKKDWVLNIFGRHDIKIHHIDNFLQLQDNGFKVTFIGLNGKKYNFSLINTNQYRNEHFEDKSIIPRVISESQEFLSLLNTTLKTTLKLSSRVTTSISQNTIIIDQLEGKTSIYDLIMSYYNSIHVQKENDLMVETSKYITGIQTEVNNSPHKVLNLPLNLSSKSMASFSKEQNMNSLKTSSNSDVHDRFTRFTKFQELINQQDPRIIAKAIVVTSQNAMAWIERSSLFTNSLGLLSFASFVMGDVDNSPYTLAFDKSSGVVSQTVFSVHPKSQPVPFRLTQMFLGALGSSCPLKIICKNDPITISDSQNQLNSIDASLIGGSYRSFFEKSLRNLRSNQLLLGPSLQFFMQKDFCERTLIPTKICHPFNTDNTPISNNENNTDENDINELYSKLDGQKVDVHNDVNQLIHQACDYNHLIKMKPRWIPWW